MSTALALTLVPVLLFLFSFLLWRRMTEDYPNEDIFFFQIFLILGAVLGLLLARVWPVGRFWFPILGVTLLGFFTARRKKISSLEALDALSLPFFLAASLGFLFFAFSLWPQAPSLVAFAEAGLGILSLLLSAAFSRYYRQLAWYPSGKVGFVGLASFSFYFLSRGVLAFFIPGVISFSGKIVDIFFGFLIPLVLLIVLYARSGREAGGDIAKFLKRIKKR